MKIDERSAARHGLAFTYFTTWGTQEIPNPDGFNPLDPNSFPFVIRAAVCACGTSQIGPPTQQAQVDARNVHEALREQRREHEQQHR